MNALQKNIPCSSSFPGFWHQSPPEADYLAAAPPALLYTRSSMRAALLYSWVASHNVTVNRIATIPAPAT